MGLESFPSPLPDKETKPVKQPPEEKVAPSEKETLADPEECWKLPTYINEDTENGLVNLDSLDSWDE